MGHVQMLGKVRPEMLALWAPALVPAFALDFIATHSIDWWLTSEDLPDPDNRITLARDGRIRLAYRPNNQEGHRRLVRAVKRAAYRIGADLGIAPGAGVLTRRMPLDRVAHQVGTVRFGHDPASSVLDVHCRAHDLDNLYVVDGSIFPSSAAVNPALTIMANALRVADHLRTRLGR
jgi:choline dehydrogenase-like flavoprotein